jgi:hypothetical protein
MGLEIYNNEGEARLTLVSPKIVTSPYSYNPVSNLLTLLHQG